MLFTSIFGVLVLVSCSHSLCALVPLAPGSFWPNPVGLWWLPSFVVKPLTWMQLFLQEVVVPFCEAWYFRDHKSGVIFKSLIYCAGCRTYMWAWSHSLAQFANFFIASVHLVLLSLKVWPLTAQTLPQEFSLCIILPSEGQLQCARIWVVQLLFISQAIF